MKAFLFCFTAKEVLLRARTGPVASPRRRSRASGKNPTARSSRRPASSESSSSSRKRPRQGRSPEASQPDSPLSIPVFHAVEDQNGLFRIWVEHTRDSKRAETLLRAAMKQIERRGGLLIDLHTVRLTDGVTVIGWQLTFQQGAKFATDRTALKVPSRASKPQGAKGSQRKGRKKTPSRRAA